MRKEINVLDHSIDIFEPVNIYATSEVFT